MPAELSVGTPKFVITAICFSPIILTMVVSSCYIVFITSSLKKIGHSNKATHLHYYTTNYTDQPVAEANVSSAMPKSLRLCPNPVIESVVFKYVLNSNNLASVSKT